MFKFKDVKTQLLEEKKKNAELQAELKSQTASPFLNTTLNRR